MTHHMRLDHKKVLRQFGPDPSRGKPMKFLPPEDATAGMVWSQFGKKFKPNPIRTYPTCALQWQRANIWRVVCEEKYWPRIAAWLVRNCG